MEQYGSVFQPGALEAFQGPCICWNSRLLEASSQPHLLSLLPSPCHSLRHSLPWCHWVKSQMPTCEATLPSSSPSFAHWLLTFLGSEPKPRMWVEQRQTQARVQRGLLRFSGPGKSDKPWGPLNLRRLRVTLGLPQEDLHTIQGVALTTFLYILE